MRYSQTGPRGSTDGVQSGQRWGGNLAYRPYLRPDAPSPITDMKVDVQEGEFAYAVRIIGLYGGQSSMPIDWLESQLDLVDRSTADVFRTVSRPFRLEARLDGRLVVTTRIRARQDCRAGWTLISHRETDDDFDEEGARYETRLGRLAAAALGACHVRETHAMLGTPTFMMNVGGMAVFRTIVPTLPQQVIAARLLDERGAMALGDLADALSSRRINGMTLAFALMLRRVIAIDLEVPLGPDSVVCAVVPPLDVMPGLFERLHSSCHSA